MVRDNVRARRSKKGNQNGLKGKGKIEEIVNQLPKTELPPSSSNKKIRVSKSIHTTNIETKVDNQATSWAKEVDADTSLDEFNNGKKEDKCIDQQCEGSIEEMNSLFETMDELSIDDVFTDANEIIEIKSQPKTIRFEAISDFNINSKELIIELEEQISTGFQTSLLLKTDDDQFSKLFVPRIKIHPGYHYKKINLRDIIINIEAAFNGVEYLSHGLYLENGHLKVGLGREMEQGKKVNYDLISYLLIFYLSNFEEQTDIFKMKDGKLVAICERVKEIAREVTPQALFKVLTYVGEFLLSRGNLEDLGMYQKYFSIGVINAEFSPVTIRKDKVWQMWDENNKEVLTPSSLTGLTAGNVTYFPMKFKQEKLFEVGPKMTIIDSATGAEMIVDRFPIQIVDFFELVMAYGDYGGKIDIEESIQHWPKLTKMFSKIELDRMNTYIFPNLYGGRKMIGKVLCRQRNDGCGEKFIKIEPIEKEEMMFKVSVEEIYYVTGLNIMVNAEIGLMRMPMGFTFTIWKAESIFSQYVDAIGIGGVYQYFFNRDFFLSEQIHSPFMVVGLIEGIGSKNITLGEAHMCLKEISQCQIKELRIVDLLYPDSRWFFLETLQQHIYLSSVLPQALHINKKRFNWIKSKDKKVYTISNDKYNRKVVGCREHSGSDLAHLECPTCSRLLFKTIHDSLFKCAGVMQQVYYFIKSVSDCDQYEKFINRYYTLFQSTGLLESVRECRDCGKNHPDVILAMFCCWGKRLDLNNQNRPNNFGQRHNLTGFSKSKLERFQGFIEDLKLDIVLSKLLEETNDCGLNELITTNEMVPFKSDMGRFGFSACQTKAEVFRNFHKYYHTSVSNSMYDAAIFRGKDNYWFQPKLFHNQFQYLFGNSPNVYYPGKIKLKQIEMCRNKFIIEKGIKKIDGWYLNGDHIQNTFKLDDDIDEIVNQYNLLKNVNYKKIILGNKLLSYLTLHWDGSVAIQNETVYKTLKTLL
jgi:hypothetical protein